MRIKARLSAAFLLVFVFGAGACRKYVTEPITRRPVISSVVAFPTVLGPGDSTMVTVFATDPDGDTLVYDWETDSRLIIQGAVLRDGSLYNTPSPSHIFYRSTVTPVSDTAWVWCTARDGKGGSDSRVVHVFFKN